MKSLYDENWSERVVINAKESQSNDKQFQFAGSIAEFSWEEASEMIDTLCEVDFKQFSEKCNYQSLAVHLGYDGHFSLENDRCVKFYNGIFRGQECYCFNHSRIEFVFLETT